MYKIGANFCFFWMIILSSLSSCGQREESLNVNGENIDGFKKKPIGWSYSLNGEQNKAYQVTLDSTTKIKGKYSFLIKNIGNFSNFGAIDYPINRTFKGRLIELKGYIKTQDVNTGYAGIWLRIDGVEGAIAFDNMSKSGVRGTNDWKPYSIKLPYDSKSAKAIHIGGLLVGNGRAWYDGFELFIDGKPLEKTELIPFILKKSDSDTVYNRSSGIKISNLTPQLVNNLAIAGQFWGFLKYHHTAIAKGEYNWDAELFRLLPNVIQAKSNSELSKALENYLDRLPKLPICNECNSIQKNIALSPNYGFLFNHSILSKSLIEKLVFVKNNRNVNTNYYLSFNHYNGNPQFDHEKQYPSMIYPDAGYRLLSLFRYWTMINYYYPYKDVIGSDWNKVLMDYIPVFINARDKNEYVLAVLRLIATVNDTHANIWGGNNILNEIKGKFTVPFEANFIENKLVITGYLVDTLGVSSKFKIGDIITSINGKKVEEEVKRYLPITPASNYDTQLRDLPSSYLLRSNENSFHISLIRNEKVLTESINGIGSSNINNKYLYKDKVAYKLLSNNIGYLFPAKYKNSDLPEVRRLFKDTKGMIIDMRGYPRDFIVHEFGAYLKSMPSSFAKVSKAWSNLPGLFIYGSQIYNGVLSNNAYTGEIIILVNSETQSRGEFTTMAFQSSKKVKVLGSITAGADGDVSKIVLPGGINTMISGIGIFYPNGDRTQRVGVKIDYKVKPTILGIMTGKDELLEKAKELLK
ncbi:S41 family peptidase [Pedobacter cryoconitis]|uniref:Tail specific protease domain-containing protein n=1 Tax=Pedobacter cryoconitis TaxID=188932 RepID=A0A7X0MN07_9SPHI|nr:S41 family peptidase [Pedobacter cryoconitis]MBB6503028.1 hypothetical protein [Pedobacter cryoconitis]